MRVGICTWGSEGDVRPFLRLARGLADRGHSVRLAYASPEARDWTGAADGFEVEPIALDWFRANQPRTGAALAELLHVRHPARQLEGIVSLLMDPVVDAMWDAARVQAESCDVLVSHFLFHPAFAAAELAKVPLVSVYTAPAVPSRFVAPMHLPSFGPLNRLLWWLAARAVDGIFVPRANALRTRVGAPALDGMYRGGLERPALNVTAVSPTLYPRPPDWSDRHLVPGFFDTPGSDAGWNAPAALRSFLAASAPPVFVGFGSMPLIDPALGRETLKLASQAVLAAGARAIVQGPLHLLDAVPTHDALLPLGPAPHAAVFPSCAAIVHHGGAGTTQAATLAGRPSVVIPHITDQFLWGALLERHGAAPRPLARTSLRPDLLASRLRRVLDDDPRFTANAARLGEAMRAESGIRTTVEAIERCAARA